MGKIGEGREKEIEKEREKGGCKGRHNETDKVKRKEKKRKARKVKNG